MVRPQVGRLVAKEPNHRHRRLLRLRRERPRRRRAAEQRDELTPFHYSITSSARACSVSGTVRPRALAVLRLMISSSFVDCWTGKSAGFAPWRIFPVYTPTRRYASLMLAP